MGAVAYSELETALARIRELEDLVQSLSYQAFVDELTGLPNRASFLQRLATLQAEADRGRKFCLVLVDLDKFKQVNDTFGHPFGDDVLRHAAGILHKTSRKADFVGRFGGEEFVMLLPDCDSEGALTVTERARRTLESEPYGCVKVTASFGICEHKPLMTANDLIRYADMAMYKAKKSGRNTVCVSSV